MSHLHPCVQGKQTQKHAPVSICVKSEFRKLGQHILVNYMVTTFNVSKTHKIFDAEVLLVLDGE